MRGFVKFLNLQQGSILDDSFLIRLYATWNHFPSRFGANKDVIPNLDVRVAINAPQRDAVYVSADNATQS